MMGGLSHKWCPQIRCEKANFCPKKYIPIEEIIGRPRVQFAGSQVSVLLSQVLAQLYIFHILHSVTFVPGSASQTDTADLAASPDIFVEH